MSNGGRRGELDARLSQNLDISPAKAGDLLKTVWDDYAAGHIDEDELWQRVEAAYGKPITIKQRDIWNKWEHTSLLPQMDGLVERLKKAGYQVGLVSNTIPNTASEIRSHGGYDIFDFVVLSCEVKAAKPDKTIYELAMAKLSRIEPAEIVFIDDQDRCLVPAREFGMATVLAINPEQTIRDVEVLLESKAYEI